MGEQFLILLMLLLLCYLVLRLMKLSEKQTNQKADWPERDKKNHVILQGHMISDTNIH